MAFKHNANHNKINLENRGFKKIEYLLFERKILAKNHMIIS